MHHVKFQTGWITSWNQDCQENINNLRHADDTTLAAESEKELKIFLMRVKEESEKAGLKLNIQQAKILASSSIISWQIGRKWKQWQTLFSLAPKSLWMVTTGMKLKDTYFLEGKVWQEYWSGLPCPPTGELLDPGIKPGFPALQVDSLPTELSGKPMGHHKWDALSTFCFDLP